MMEIWLEKGGPVMVPLLALSFAALALVFERFLFWRREGRVSARAVLEQQLASEPSGGGCTPQTVLELCVGREQRRLEKGMAVLDTTITTAPLLGILGTVLGIISSFEFLSVEGGVDPLAISGGVAEALISTATGLVIALVVLFPYNYFRTRLRARVEDLEDAAQRLLAEHTSERGAA